jgi:transcriptional regulator with XRE-family HTH domain
MPKLSEQVRLKIREEMARLEMSQRDVAELLGWSQSRVAHLLNGRVEMSVDDLAEFAFILTIRPTEIIRDHGLEFCAEMTPTELRFLERLRQLPQTQKDAMMQLFHIESMTRPQERRAAPPQRKKR